MGRSGIPRGFRKDQPGDTGPTSQSPGSPAELPEKPSAPPPERNPVGMLADRVRVNKEMHRLKVMEYTGGVKRRDIFPGPNPCPYSGQLIRSKKTCAACGAMVSCEEDPKGNIFVSCRPEQLIQEDREEEIATYGEGAPAQSLSGALKKLEENKSAGPRPRR